MKNIDIETIIAQNAERNAALGARADYDPMAGRGCYGERVEVAVPGGGIACVPVAMIRDADYALATSPVAWQRLRCRHDFEYWCARCVRIQHKGTGRRGPMVLNYPQRRVVAILEADRLAGRPMRLIILKARQWGGSTVVQMYMAWLQCVRRTSWHSLIIAHNRDTSAKIRSIYTRMLDAYPHELWEGDQKPEFKCFEGTTSVREIAGRDCQVTLGTAEAPDSIRGADYSMAHLSETAFWPATVCHNPDDIIRAVCGAIADVPDTLIAMESTANGVGSYFHTEWMRSAAGKSDKRAIFVPWYEIEICRREVDDPAALWACLTAYERGLWDDGLTLEQICWYHYKALGYQSIEQLHAEYPTTPDEAFANTGNSVFAVEKVDALRRGCRAPLLVGAISSSGQPVAESLGNLQVWEYADSDEAYVVAVDVGGRTAQADWSVIAVLTAGDVPRVVAQWRGHTDLDLLADEAMRIARYYNDALLVVESNTFESRGADCGENLPVLARLAAQYPNLYTRTSIDRITHRVSDRVGFHTNRRTKPLLINGLIAALRDGTYIERDNEACNEMATYTRRANGVYEARQGRHDDILMTRALALHILTTEGVSATPVPDLFNSDVW